MSVKREKSFSLFSTTFLSRQNALNIKFEITFKTRSVHNIFLSMWCVGGQNQTIDKIEFELNKKQVKCVTGFHFSLLLQLFEHCWFDQHYLDFCFVQTNVFFLQWMMIDWCFFVFSREKSTMCIPSPMIRLCPLCQKIYFLKKFLLEEI